MCLSEEMAGDDANWSVSSCWQKSTEMMFLASRKKGSGGEEVLDKPALRAVCPKAVSTQSDLGQKRIYLCERGEISDSFSVFIFFF